MTRILSGCAAALLLLAVPSRANAATIGVFSYDVDEFFGPVFTIENAFDSPGAFTNIVIHLLSSVDNLDVLDLQVADLGAGSLGQAFLDDPFAVLFDSAVLTLTFSQPGTVQADALTNLTFDLGTFTGNTATTAITFTPETPVPEPSTLLLLAGGAAFAFRRRRTRTTR